MSFTLTSDNWPVRSWILPSTKNGAVPLDILEELVDEYIAGEAA